MEKVTIHRALSELKLIGARIEKQIQELEPAGIVQKDKLVNGTTKKDDFENTAKARYQAVTDLIDRRAKIKAAIVLSNSVTDVAVAGVKMTVADAITQKALIESKKMLITHLKRKNNNAKSQLEQNNTRVDNNALDIAKVTLGKQGIKLQDDDVKRTVDPYLNDNRFSLVDPLALDKEIPDLEKKVADFEAEVDAILSEANATTFIEI